MQDNALTTNGQSVRLMVIEALDIGPRRSLTLEHQAK